MESHSALRDGRKDSKITKILLLTANVTEFFFFFLRFEEFNLSYLSYSAQDEKWLDEYFYTAPLFDL